MPQKLQQNHSLLRSSEINSGNNSSPSFCHGGPEIRRDHDDRQGDQRMRQPELERQLELLGSQPERLGRQPKLPWSTENHLVVLATIGVLIALAAMKFQNPSDNPFHSRPTTMAILVIALCIYGIAAARTRSIMLTVQQQKNLMWPILYYCYRLLNSLVLISGVVCLACIASLFIPYGLGWIVYVACAGTFCVLVAVWDILCVFLGNSSAPVAAEPSCVVPCLGPTGSSGGSKKNDGESDCDYNGGIDGRNRIAESNESPVCGSSVVLENQSSSRQGGTSSSDAGTQSGHCKAEQSHLKHTCEHGVPSRLTDHSTQANGKTENNGNTVLPHIIQSSPQKGTESEAHPDPDEKSIQFPNPLEVARDQGLDTPSLSQMPCVSTSASYKPAPFDHPLDV